MEVHNRDVFPAHEVQNVYVSVAPLIVNPLIDKPFLAHENAAKQAKQHFHRFGRIGILLVLLSTTFMVAERLVMGPFPGHTLLSIIFVLIGIAGLGIQIQLLLKKKKQLWLLHRFAAERLRGIKFQGYRLATIAHSTQNLQELTDVFYSGEVARLDEELNAGYSALMNFSPAKALAEDWATVNSPVSEAIEAAARTAYRDLRIVYQRRFAQGEILALQQKQRIGYTYADILYLMGATLSIAALICKITFPDATTVSSWVDFLAVTAFVVGLVMTIMDNASLAETSKVRYEDYVRALGECENELRLVANFSEVVRRIERVVMEEISDFCQSASQISYRL